MVKLKKRDFIGLAIAGSTIAGLAIFLGNKPKSSLLQVTKNRTLYEYFAIVYGNPEIGYKAIDNDGQILFDGKCSDGSGTCGIYEALEYVESKYGYGKIAIFGNFYPVNSPSISSNVEIEGNATIYVNSNSLPFILSLQLRNIRVLWYKTIGIINNLLTKRNIFSLNPYVLFTNTYESLLLCNGKQTIGEPSSFTISAWVNGMQNPYGGYILSYGSLERGIVWTLQNTQNSIIFSGSSGKVSSIAPQSTPFHIGITWNNGYTQLYINGKMVSSAEIQIEYKSPAYIWINNFPIQSQQGGLNLSSWSSYIENIQLYNSVLSESQISQLASSPLQDPVDQSIILWALYRYIMYLGDLITGKGFQRIGSLFYNGPI
ncbi:MAG: LamG domain-containing protein [Saccharolobus sp.]|uniref:LamG domain-containing protein n=1 Tax=Saccharolobus TaxID=2100760 RepID=UPI001F110E0B|nr:LamG domain-containing protein [Saccharolobus shibatae]MCH4816295.1 LamG domain-containing protein [Saccharolobus shibatae]